MQENKKELIGHLLALSTIFVWGTTFISTKVLLNAFTPVEILFYRFTLGLLVLWIVFPKLLKWTTWQKELIFASAGLCGVTLYFLLENIALTYTLASNVGVIIAIAPIFTVLILRFSKAKEKLRPSFLLGFLIALMGIILINFNGSFVLKLNPTGDLLAIAAAFVWAVYSILIKKISQWGYSTIQTTRRTFSYGILFMIPSLFILPFKGDFERFLVPVNLLNFLFLGIGASALCFVTWNIAIKTLGPIKTSTYIYLVPAVTVITSVLILNEQITWLSFLGTILILLGLFLSERKVKNTKEVLYQVSE